MGFLLKYLFGPSFRGIFVWNAHIFLIVQLMQSLLRINTRAGPAPRQPAAFWLAIKSVCKFTSRRLTAPGLIIRKWYPSRNATDLRILSPCREIDICVFTIIRREAAIFFREQSGN